MSFLKGASLIGSLLLAPAGFGTAAHFLKSYYRDIMNFEGAYFIVEAITDLYDKGIPKIPDSVLKEAKKIAEELEREKSKNSQNGNTSNSSSGGAGSSESSKVNDNNEQKQAIFGDKKGFWCRFFDYTVSKEKSGEIENVKLQYDPNCQLFNLIPIKPQQNKNLVESSSEMKLNWNSENYFKPQVLDIKEINNKINNLKNVELKNNSDFQKGGFYVLKVDKNKIPSIRVNTQIELSETPKERIRFPEQKYHQKIATLKVKAPLVGDILQKVPFKFDVSYPSSMLLVKKINHDSSLVKTSGEKNSSNNKEKIYSYFLKNNNKTNQDLNLQKVGVLGIWEFPDFLTSSKSSTSDLSGLDLRFAKKVDYANLKGNSHNNNSSWLDIILGKEKNKEGYYLIRTDNSYWNYKIKDKINLFRVERKENQENQTNSEEASKQEENLTNFEIVSGVISQIPLSRTCSLKKFTIQDELKNPIIIWEKIQNKVSTKGTIDPEEKFCEENNENIPPSTMILMGYNLKNNKITK